MLHKSTAACFGHLSSRRVVLGSRVAPYHLLHVNTGELLPAQQQDCYVIPAAPTISQVEFLAGVSDRSVHPAK